MARKHNNRNDMNAQVKAPSMPPQRNEPTHQEDELMSTGDVARAINRHPNTVLNWIRDGLLRAVRINGRFSVRRSEVNKLLSGSAIQERIE